MLLRFDIVNFVWKKTMLGRQKALFWFLFLFFLTFSQLNIPWKFELTTLHFSLSIAFKLLFLTIEGKWLIVLSFFLPARFEQLNTSQNPGFFKLIFLFHFVIIFYSLSSRPLSSRPLFLIVLYKGVKSIHVRKKWFVTSIGRENTFDIKCNQPVA